MTLCPDFQKTLSLKTDGEKVGCDQWGAIYLTELKRKTYKAKDIEVSF